MIDRENLRSGEGSLLQKIDKLDYKIEGQMKNGQREVEDVGESS